MAYQNVGTPRFFIDNYIYLRALGLDPQEYIDETNNNILDRFKTPLDNENTFTLSPNISKQYIVEDMSMQFFIPCEDMIKDMDFSGNMKWYGALLNHNLGDCEAIVSSSMFMSKIGTEGGDTYIVHDEDYDEILNIHDAGYLGSQKNGTTIWTSDLNPTEEARFTGFKIGGGASIDLSNFQVGAVSMGVMYTMPHSADLSLSMEIEFDGYDEVKTLGGSTLVNIRQTGAPVWVNDGKYNSPFSVGDFSNNKYLGGAKRNGRRSWKLKFSYISDSDIFASNYMNTNHLENDAINYDSDDSNATSDVFEYNMFTDDSFVSQVWNKTLAGALNFIFQPDSSNDNPDQFCIAKFDMDSLTVKQVAYKTYSFEIKIIEVW